MRIGLLTTSYPRFPGDYAGSFVGDRVHALVSAGHEVAVVAAGDGLALPAARDEMLADGGAVRVTRLPAGALFYGPGAPETLERGGAAAWLAGAAFSSALASLVRIRRQEWDLVEAHWLVPCALAAAAGAPELPRRAYAHSGDVALLERLPFGRALARYLARGGTELRFVTGALRDRFAALSGACSDPAMPRGEVEPLGVLPTLFSPRPGRAPDPALRRRLDLRGPTVLAVGRLVPIKGHASLLRACARRSPADSPLEVVILGDGPERDRLCRLAERLDLSLRLPGFVPRPEVADWLRAADLFAQPSVELPNGRTEGAPVATLEARAVGIPVVTESVPDRLRAAIRGALATAGPPTSTV